MDDQNPQQPNQPSDTNSPAPAAPAVSDQDQSSSLPPVDAQEQEMLKIVEQLKKEEASQGQADAQVIDKREEEYKETEENKQNPPSAI